MTFFRNHWFDIGGVFGIALLVWLSLTFQKIPPYQLLMWLSLVSLLFHQTEEYRIAGTFPGVVNRVMFRSDLPDRYPLNSNTSLIINVWIGWTVYLLAALTGDRFIWLGMATILVSSGNIIAHTFIFNMKGKTLYNAGLATSWLLFAPCVFFFFKIIHDEDLATMADYLIGIPLGIIVNIFGVFKPITWFADRETRFIFNNRQLLPCDRKNKPTDKNRNNFHF